MDFLNAALYKALGIHSASQRKFQVKLNPCVCLFCGSQLFLWHVTLIGGRYKISLYSYTTCSFSSAHSPKCLINKLWTLMGNSAFLGECWPRDNRKCALCSLHAVLLLKPPMALTTRSVTYECKMHPHGGWERYSPEMHFVWFKV